MTAMPAVATNVYRVLLYLYPPAFRRQFASEMACDFEEATGEAWRDGRWPAVVPLWIHICRDLAWTVAAQWFRNGFPVVPVLSALGATMFGFAVTRLLWLPRQPISPGLKDEVVLLFLAVMVILLAATVITFTVCFWLLVLRRNGRVRRV
jgi:hypothetical protein